ncbi:hypothetical protein K490DRAFT_67264 [Saccharata proteae CBS 121410]|uniref:Uncharacterized protein n=1 Tax=Saccharata proteae CBS 121410 TaxID=1314787 RepID=A0A9P4LYI1_9PEZI|nr:hypothetical protein K490DRAFT_67264 [Saccharata proteae CBS 121410]
MAPKMASLQGSKTSSESAEFTDDGEFSVNADDTADCESLETEILTYCNSVHPGKSLSVQYHSYLYGEKNAKSERVIRCESQVVHYKDPDIVCLYEACSDFNEPDFLEREDLIWTAVLRELRAIVRIALAEKNDGSPPNARLPQVVPIRSSGPSFAPDADDMARNSCEIFKREILTYMGLSYPGLEVEFVFPTTFCAGTNSHLECYGQILCKNTLQGSKNGSSRFQLFESHAQIDKECYLSSTHWCHAALLRDLRQQVKRMMEKKFGAGYPDKLVSEALGGSMLPRGGYRADATSK